MPKVHVLETEVWLARPIDEVFGFFSDAHNLNEITPPMLDFRILTPKPIPMGKGTLIDYRISLRGFPMRWRTLISAWEPGKRFVDEQLKGPYHLWRHEHTFEARDGGTLCKDRVEYAHWGGPLIQRWLVGPDVTGIFEYRKKRLVEMFGGGGPDGQMAKWSNG